MATYLLENTRPRVFRIADVTLMPGMNEVTDEQWDSIKKNPFTQLALDEGEIKWQTGRGPGDTAKEVKKLGPYPLKGLTAKEATAIVKKTTAIPTLESWLRIETRKEIIAAINAQVKEIQKVDEDQDEKKELAKIGQEGGK